MKKSFWKKTDPLSSDSSHVLSECMMFIQIAVQPQSTIPKEFQSNGIVDVDKELQNWERSDCFITAA